MLGKILKYDIKRLGHPLLPLYVITILMSFLNLKMQSLSASNAIFSVMSGLLTIVFVLLLIGTILGTFVLCIRYFYVHLLTDEGYLTNTLPVTKGSLVLSKVIVSIVYTIMSIFVVILSTEIGFLHYFNLIDVLKKIYDSGFFQLMMGLEGPWAILYFIFMMALSYLSQLLFFFFALALGQRHSTNRILYSFVYGILLYCIQQAISFLTLGGLMLIYPDILNTPQVNVLPTDMLQTLYATTTVTSLVIIAVYWYGTVHMLSKKLNLE